MAFAFNDIAIGAPVTWTSSGGDLALTLTSLADGAAREGVKSPSWVDQTRGLPEWIEVRLEVQPVSAAANGTYVELYVGESDNASAGLDNPGNLSGADAALANPDEMKLQLGLVGRLMLSNGMGANVQKQRFRWSPMCAYCVPLVVNKAGVALGATGANMKCIMTPYYSRYLNA